MGHIGVPAQPNYQQDQFTDFGPGPIWVAIVALAFFVILTDLSFHACLVTDKHILPAGAHFIHGFFKMRVSLIAFYPGAGVFFPIDRGPQPGKSTTHSQSCPAPLSGASSS